MKSLRIARRLLWANRWLWLLLMLWPWAMAAILSISSGGHPAAEDVEAALGQQGIYGLALVAFAGGSLLGNEQRSRRIATVMACAVSRRTYLGALWLTAALPLLAYTFSLALTGWLMSTPADLLAQSLAALLMLGAIAASVTILASLALPGVVAGLLSLIVLSLPLALPPGWQIALTRLLQVLLTGVVTPQIGMVFGAGLLEAGLLTAGVFEATVRIFERRDLRLKSE